MFRLFPLLVVTALLFPATINAQALYGQRLQSIDGQWLLPVATRLLGSDEADHLRRGSVNAWDLTASTGTPVFAAAVGSVRYAGCNDAGHYGCWVQLDHGSGITSSYAHCIDGSVQVAIGQTVDHWTQLCSVGQTGWASWPHTHFVIQRNGEHVMLDQIFDKSAMHHCFWSRSGCLGANAPDAPITGAVAGMGQPRQQQRVVASPGLRFLAVMVGAATDAGAVGLFWLLVGSTFVLLMSLWLSPAWLRVMLSAGIVAAVCSFVVVLMFLPTMTTAAGGDWQTAYRFTAGAEGWKCTEDGAHTFGGVTQGTYNRWLRTKGIQPTEVCGNLTEQQRQQIFYELFWMPSGAATMPKNLALTYVDHMFNTGDAKPGLVRCGFDVKCFNDWRVQDYLSMRTCFEYCRGWLNRVENIRSITEVKQ